MARSVKLLLVDDDGNRRAAILRALRDGLSGVDAHEADSAEAFARALEVARFDLAIVQRRLAWSCGLKLGEILRKRYPDCPMLLISPDGNTEAAVEALRSGFDDYLPESPGRLARLPRTTGVLLESARARRRADWTEARTQDLLARLNVGVYRATTRGIILYANSAFCKIFGIASWREAPAWSLRSAMADPSEGSRLERDLKRSGFLQAVELRLKGPGGRDRWISLTQSLKNGTDNLGVIEGLVEDVTERKARNLAMRRREEERLQAQRLETVGRLAGGVAHDFNNLLTAINGYSDLLLEDLKEDNPLRANVLEIRKAGARAAMLTRQLMASSSRLLLRPIRMDLNALVRRMDRSIREALGEAIRYVPRLAAELGPVNADISYLENAIMILVLNARDAMPCGGVLQLWTGTLEVPEAEVPAGPGAPGEMPGPGRYALLVVEDNGVGMVPEVLARIFEPFFSTKTRGLGNDTGKGMGLSTAYGILKQSGGTIRAESEPGKGTRMSLCLPFDRTLTQVAEASE